VVGSGIELSRDRVSGVSYSGVHCLAPSVRLLWNARLPQQQRTGFSEAVRVCVRCDYRIVEWK
jgi:hypothetical protein